MADGKRQPCRFKKSACQARSDLRHPVYCAAQPGTHGFHRVKPTKKSILSRPCFLCRKNQPEDQRVCPIGDGYNLCVNPYPILPYHITIPSAEHREQILPADFCNTVSTLLNELPDEYALFYNGALCGASAPRPSAFSGSSDGARSTDCFLSPDGQRKRKARINQPFIRPALHRQLRLPPVQHRTVP